MTPALQSVLSPAGPDAALLSRLGWVLFAVGAAIFLLVAVLVLASVVRKRGRSWSRRLVVGGGLVLPLPLLAALMAWSGWQASMLTWPFSGTRIQVTVIAHMWWWEVRYRDTVTGREVVLANELRLPVGERVYLALASADVLHAFWVPALAGKVDMVPGRVHGLTLRADTPGRYRGQCAEYCGTQHAAMALDVVAVAPGEFAAWLEHQAAPAASIAAAPAAASALAVKRPEAGLPESVLPGAAVSGSSDAVARLRGAWPPTGAAAASAATGSGTGSVDGLRGKAAAPIGADQGIHRGREVFLAARCNACHTVRGVAEGGTLGPDLTHVAGRARIAAGTLPMNRAAIIGWIANPQAAKPGARMPPASLPPDDLQALASWLESLQ